MVGTWRRILERGRLLVVAEPFARLTASERRGFDAPMRRFALFQGIELAAPAGVVTTR